MMFKWNAKADSASAIVMWLVTVTAAVILGYWILKSTRPVHMEIKNIDNELEVLQQSLSTACDLEYYRYKYNPKLVKGNIMIRNSEICIDNQNCRAFYYSGQTEPPIIDGDLVTNTSEICHDISKCSSIYFFSSEDMQINGTSLTIPDVTLCEPVTPILRCLPLVCDTNTSLDINLENVVHVEIKHENGSFDVKKYVLQS